MENVFAANIVGILIGLPFIILIIVQIIKEFENKSDDSKSSNKSNDRNKKINNISNKKSYSYETYVDVIFDGSLKLHTYIAPQSVTLYKGQKITAMFNGEVRGATVVSSFYTTSKKDYVSEELKVCGRESTTRNMIDYETYVDVRFDYSPKIYTYIAPENRTLRNGDRVLIRTFDGMEYVEIVGSPYVTRKKRDFNYKKLDIYDR